MNKLIILSPTRERGFHLARVIGRQRNEVTVISNLNQIRGLPLRDSSVLSEELGELEDEALLMGARVYRISDSPIRSFLARRAKFGVE